jgi:hypothetical protein
MTKHAGPEALYGLPKDAEEVREDAIIHAAKGLHEQCEPGSHPLSWDHHMTQARIVVDALADAGLLASTPPASDPAVEMECPSCGAMVQSRLQDQAVIDELRKQGWAPPDLFRELAAEIEKETAMADPNSAPTSYQELAHVIEILPELVREKRRRDGLSVRQVGVILDISASTISRFETRSGEQRGDNLLALLRWVGQPTAEATDA